MTIRFREPVAVFVVAEMEPSLRYYEEALGFEVAFRWGDPTFYAGVCRDDATIHLQAVHAADRPAGAARVALMVGDVDALHRELCDRGARVEGPPETRPYGIRNFVVEDPDGNTLVLSRPAEDRGD